MILKYCLAPSITAESALRCFYLKIKATELKEMAGVHRNKEV